MSTNDPQEPGSPDIMVEFRDPEGRVVASVLNVAEDLEYPFQRNLHSLARRSALKIDDVLDAMLKSLKPK